MQNILKSHIGPLYHCNKLISFCFHTVSYITKKSSIVATGFTLVTMVTHPFVGPWKHHSQYKQSQKRASDHSKERKGRLKLHKKL